jgi:hypothetical protein
LPWKIMNNVSSVYLPKSIDFFSLILIFAIQYISSLYIGYLSSIMLPWCILFLSYSMINYLYCYLSIDWYSLYVNNSICWVRLFMITILFNMSIIFLSLGIKNVCFSVVEVVFFFKFDMECLCVFSFSWYKNLTWNVCVCFSRFNKIWHGIVVCVLLCVFSCVCFSHLIKFDMECLFVFFSLCLK